jgi:hypothetical protein
MTSKMTSFAFVTAIYALRDGYTDQLLERFGQLLKIIPSDCLIYVWSDLDLPAYDHTGVRHLREPITNFECYRLGTQPGLTLPSRRTPSKDTAEYMSLMNTKLEMIRRVAEILPDTVKTAAWIDCGVSKIWKNAEAVRSNLERVTTRRPADENKMIVPGCWPPRYPPRTEIYWRFSGGFFLVSVSFIERLYKVFISVYKKLVEEERVIVWELNTWALAEYWYPSAFQWYLGDHNESLFAVPEHFLTPE